MRVWPVTTLMQKETSLVGTVVPLIPLELTTLFPPVGALPDLWRSAVGTGTELVS